MKKLLGLIFMIGAFSVAAAAQEAVDVAVVLAVDVSSSISPEEYQQQKRGIVTALRDPEVGRVLEQCNANGVALTFIEWAGLDHRKRIGREIGWHKLNTATDLHHFADKIERARERGTEGFTDIINALSFSAQLLSAIPFEARRKIINVSGDGAQNTTPPGGGKYLNRDEMLEALRAERDQIVARGIVIDALVITNDEEEFRRVGPLDRYFSQNVIGGRGSNMRTIEDFTDYAKGLKANLLAELDNCLF